MSPLLHRYRPLAVLLLVALAAFPARAGELDKFITPDTDLVVHFNFNQLMGSSLLRKLIPLAVDKYGEDVMNMAAQFQPDENIAKAIKAAIPQMKAAVKDPEAVARVMDGIKEAFDDIVFHANIAGSSDDEPKFIMFFRSRLLTAELFSTIAGAMEQQGQVKMKAIKFGDDEAFEIEVPNAEDKKLYLAIVEDGVMSMTMIKSMLGDALKVAKTKAPKMKASKEIQDLLALRKPSQTFFMVGTPKKEGVERLKAIFTVDTDIKGEMEAITKDEATAKKQADETNEGIESMKAMMGGMLDEASPAMKKLAEMVNNLKAEAKGKSMTMKFMLKGSLIEEALKK